MSDTTVLMKKPADLLRQAHERRRDLFARYESVDRSDAALKRELLLKIDEEVSTHSRIEETLFYPAMRKVDPDRVGQALEGHRTCKRLVEELMETDDRDPGFDAKLKDLGRSLERHSRMEEAELFPLATRLPRKAQQELSVGIADLRERPTRKDRPVEVPFYPTLGPSHDGPPPPPGAPGENKAQGYENWGSE